MTTHSPQEFATGLAAKLATRVRSELGEADRVAFDRQMNGRNVEQVLSRLRRIAGLVIGDDKVDGLTADVAATLDATICQSIIRALDIADANLTASDNLAAWVARADYRLPVEIFTVNYDLLLETGLDVISQQVVHGQPE